ncbi:MAG: glycosyltransferase N-terminal domain-containing protein [bacterium]
MISPILTAVARVLYRTLRWRIQVSEQAQRAIRSGKPLLVAFWHGHALLIPGAFQKVFPRGSEISVFIGRRRDGKLIACTVKPFGIRVIPGSTRRDDGRSLRDMIRALDQGRSLALMPDGPVGPRCKARPDATALGMLGGVPILPVSWTASRGIRLRTWDRLCIPLPFARAAVTFGDPLTVRPSETDTGPAAQALRLESALNELARQTGAYLRKTAFAERLCLVYSLALYLLTLPALPFFAWKLLSVPKYRSGFLQRLGLSVPGSMGKSPEEQPVWVHAVSVGEVLATVPFIRRLKQAYPQRPIVVSTITPTGQTVAREHFAAAGRVIYFPFDYPFSTRLVLKHVQPKLFVHTETEIWPNFLFMLGRHGIPSVIVNGRISARSCRQYGWFRFFFRQVLESVSAFGMQSKQDCLRIIRIGADPRRVFVTGNMKFDVCLHRGACTPAPPAPQDFGFPPSAPVWVAGSTHPGEEETILKVFDKLRGSFPTLKLLLAPRHPERCADVEQLVRRSGLRVLRRTGGKTGIREIDVLLLDTMGELAQAYAIGDIVFVGGSLTPVGGHNLLEPIVHRRPVLFGPHMENTPDVARALLERGGGIQVSGEEPLYLEAARLLRDPDRRRTIADAAYGILEENRGATERNLSLVGSFFGT